MTPRRRAVARGLSRRAALGAVAIVMAAGLAPISAVGGSRSGLVVCPDEGLTARLDQVPIDEVIDLFAHATGADIRGEPIDLRAVTKHFDCVPLPEAFKRLLGAQNFVMRYGADGRLTAVDLLGATEPPAAPHVRRVRQIGARVFAMHAPVPLERELAAAVGGPTGRLPQLLAVALGNDDVVIRRRAVRKLLRVFEQDQGLRDVGLAALRGTEDRPLIDLVYGKGAERAAEFLTTVTSEATDGYLRARARRLLRTARRIETPQRVAADTPPGA